jgi:hypothetical protein
MYLTCVSFLGGTHENCFPVTRAICVRACVCCLGHKMADAFGHRPLNVGTRVRCQAGQCGM